jgi:hypothetical protein
MKKNILKSSLVGLITTILIGLIVGFIFLAISSYNIIYIILTIGSIFFICISCLTYIIYYS